MRKTLEECITWMRKKLSGGSVVCDYIREEGRKEGFTRGQLSQARKILGVVTFHQFDEDGATPNWFWSLPDERIND